MDVLTADRVTELAVVLSVLSISLVVAAASGTVPSSVVPGAPGFVLSAIPTINAIVSAAAIVSIGAGWFAIRRGQVARHRRYMLTAIGLFATFLVLYCYRLIAAGGAAGFDGPTAIYQYVYLPVLAIHIGLAIWCIPLLYYVILLAVTHDVSALRSTRHRAVGRVVVPLWIGSFGLGIVVYLLGIAWR